MVGDSSISEFDALQGDVVLELLAQCIARLPLAQKTVLALYYHENLEPTEIAACLDLTFGVTRPSRLEFARSRLQMLAGQVGVPELPASFDKPRDADGAGVLVNG